MLSKTLHHQRGRRHSSKRKTGCRNCKHRRIKCDEERPACQQCQKTRRVCPGYGETIASTTNGKTLVLTWSISSRGPCLNAREQAGLHSFLTCCRHSLAGAFGQELWLHLIPQRAQENAIVRHAVVALGASAVAQATTSQARKNNADHAARQYGMAMQMLQQQMESGHRSTCPMGVLLACLLFVTLKLQQRENEEAEQHLSAGLRILRETSASNHSDSVQSHLCPSRIDYYRQIQAAFQRLDLQFSFYNSTHIKLVGEMSAETCRAGDVLPSAMDFSTVLEAEQSLNICLRLMRELMYDVGRQRKDGRDLQNDASEELRRRQMHVLLLFARWDNALRRILPTLRSNNDTATAALLQTHQISAMLMTSTCLLVRPFFGWKRYTPQFVELVEKAKHFIALSSMVSEAITMPKFGIEMGVIPPLYLTALRCHQLDVRHEAVQLLKMCSQREGLWDGPFMAAACESVINLELPASGMHDCIDDSGGYHRQLYQDFFDVRADCGSLKYRQRCSEEDVQRLEFDIPLTDNPARQQETMEKVHQHARQCYRRGEGAIKPLID